MIEELREKHAPGDALDWRMILERLDRIDRLLEKWSLRFEQHMEKLMSSIDDLNKAVADLGAQTTRAVSAIQEELTVIQNASNNGDTAGIAAAVAKIQGMTAQLQTAADSVTSVTTPVPPVDPTDPGTPTDPSAPVDPTAPVDPSPTTGS